jgi:hypothetical protein
VLRARLAVVVSSVLLLAACASAGEARDQDRDPDSEHVGEVSEALTAQCTANVAGHGVVDVEKVYLPDVVHCENGGAPLESLKAQAIAARTYLYYKLETSSSISDGQGDQVLSCGSHAGALEKQAVAETAGMILRYSGTTIAAFFVAGGNASPPACHDSSSSTSGDVTYNAGKTGNAIHQTPLGFVDPSNLRNRGCMSQLGSRCLADEGDKADAILRFYYGDDIAITEATGPCVPTPPKADAGSDGASGDAATYADGGGAGGEGSIEDDAAGGGGGARVGTSGSGTTGAPVEEHGSADASGCSLAREPRDARDTTLPGWAIVALGAMGVVVARRRGRASRGSRAS